MKVFRSAEKSFKAALSCDPNDENSRLKLIETLRLFIKECGFSTDKEINELSQQFNSCSEFSNALIDGLLCDVNDCCKESSGSYESPRNIPDESDLIRSVSISNELNFDSDDEEEKDNSAFIPLINSTNNSSDLSSIAGNGAINEDLIRWMTPEVKENGAIDANDSKNDIRLPKSVPLFCRTNRDLKTNIESKIDLKTNIETKIILTNDQKGPKVQMTDSVSNDLTPKKLVKTRPVIRRSFVN